MPKSKSASSARGGKNRRRGKKDGDLPVKRELEYAEEGQCYAQVLKMLGNGRVEAHCFHDEKKRLCHIRGKMRKKVWINVSDIVLVGLREFQDEKADIIHKYSPDEARTLKKQGELPDYVRIGDVGGIVGDGDGAGAHDAGEGAFEFDMGGSEDEMSDGGDDDDIDLDDI